MINRTYLLRMIFLVTILLLVLIVAYVQHSNDKLKKYNFNIYNEGIIDAE